MRLVNHLKQRSAAKLEKKLPSVERLIRLVEQIKESINDADFNFRQVDHLSDRVPLFKGASDFADAFRAGGLYGSQLRSQGSEDWTQNPRYQVSLFLGDLIELLQSEDLPSVEEIKLLVRQHELGSIINRILKENNFWPMLREVVYRDSLSGRHVVSLLVEQTRLFFRDDI